VCPDVEWRRERADVGGQDPIRAAPHHDPPV
jgi:hypothetical protein